MDPQEKPIIKNIPIASSIGTKTLLIGIGVLFLAIGTGYVLYLQTGGSVANIGTKAVVQDGSGEIKKGQAYGSADTKLFPDTAEGTLEKGGFDGEGSHKLIRPGGDSQTAYLTSSTLDLNNFAGKKVRIWGKTYAAQKAPWLLDVGRVEVLE